MTHMAYLWLADHSQNLLLLQQLLYTLKPRGFSLHTLRTNSAFDLCQSEQMARKCQRALCKVSHAWIIIRMETVGFKPWTLPVVTVQTRKAQFCELTWKSCLHFISIDFYSLWVITETNSQQPDSVWSVHPMEILGWILSSPLEAQA